MDSIDMKILEILERNSEISLRKIGIAAGLNSPSAVARRIDAMKKEGIIGNSISLINYKKLGFQFYTVTFVRAKYGKEYYKDLGKTLAGLPGVISVDFLLGDIDFIIYTVNRNADEYQKLMDRLSTIEGIERTDSHIVLQNFSRDNYSNIKF
ncbi:MAG: Lrp/AsnC family transcriptional regulator [Ferroplasma sp.]|uniref:Lrp/AsnC family transcriptional regulator n=1 Tax=Ferroplasma sp. TaxID=2591003 RepID=UPI002815541D|nr:Lrp/AsnC family transcriptional regulator [Ferroplasma sp.]WMT50716.1 MAG: Lrp/AsnC family transcriptional regulator [Ferroplasma sp.]